MREEVASVKQGPAVTGITNTVSSAQALLSERDMQPGQRDIRPPSDGGSS